MSGAPGGKLFLGTHVDGLGILDGTIFQSGSGVQIGGDVDTGSNYSATHHASMIANTMMQR